MSMGRPTWRCAARPPTFCSSSGVAFRLMDLKFWAIVPSSIDSSSSSRPIEPRRRYGYAGLIGAIRRIRAERYHMSDSGMRDVVEDGLMDFNLRVDSGALVNLEDVKAKSAGVQVTD